MKTATDRPVLMILTIALWLAAASATAGEAPPEDDNPPKPLACPPAVPIAAQEAAEARLRQAVPELLVSRRGPRTAVHTFYNPIGFLTAGNPRAEAETIAVEYLVAQRELLGLTAEDLASREVTDSYRSQVSGTHRIYFRQIHAGLAVHNGQLQVNVDRDGRVISVANAFVPGLAAAVNATRPELGAAAAVERAAADLGLAAGDPPAVVAGPSGADQRTRVEAAEISTEPIEARLAWFPPDDACDVRLAWSFTLHTRDRMHVFDQLVDAVTGDVLWRQDRVLNDSYTVFALPFENPNRGSRTKEVDPADPTASPLDWHDVGGPGNPDFTTMQGNNVHAYTDEDSTDSPTGSERQCGQESVCNFSFNLSNNPAANAGAALTNAFYWTNVVHDVSFLYGFDEAAGNFQAVNLNNVGQGGDDVQVEVLDRFGDGTDKFCHDGLKDVPCRNNASFLLTTEGFQPRLSLWVWDECTTCSQPLRDSAFDSGTLVHENAHGISTRLVGGANTATCLSNDQQPGEGISDFFALAFTHEAGFDGDSPRGRATFLKGEPSDGAGIRIQRYSTDPQINTYHYETIRNRSRAHDIGEVWTQAAWQAYWALIDRHGFDPDLYNATGGAGNQRMLLYTVQGLANTACDPTFTDLRDGILQAAAANHGGEDLCLLWNAFADFGLGRDADDDSTGGTQVVNGFATPAACRCIAPPSDMIGWWPLDEPQGLTTHDQSDLGMGNDAALLGFPPARRGRGLVDDALVFDGVDDLLIVPANADFNAVDFDESGLSLEMWIMPRELPETGANFTLARFGGQGPYPDNLVLGIDDQGRLVLEVFQSGSLAVTLDTGPGVIEAGKWSHLALTMAGPPTEENRLYVDGIREAERKFSFVLPATGNSLDLGRFMPSDGFYAGRIDEVALYGRALTQTEIRDIFVAYNAGRCKEYCGRDKTRFDRVFQMYSASGSLQGSSGDDLILGSPGGDTISGDDGDDCIYGFDGNDEIEGDRDRDTVFGGDGDDVIEGNEGDDLLRGGPGFDTIRGRRGKDTIFGGTDSDVIEGNEGDDVIHGGGGPDTLHGRRGNDTIFGGADSDVIEGNEGDDVIHGGDGPDTIDGHRGDDEIHGDGGDDVIAGNDGWDVLAGGDGDDEIDGGDGKDTIQGDDGRDRLRGGPNDDEIDGGPGGDFLRGEVGNDTLYGRAGDDRLCGEENADILDGGPGSDEYRGGGGQDVEINVENEIAASACYNAAFDAW